MKDRRPFSLGEVRAVVQSHRSTTIGESHKFSPKISRKFVSRLFVFIHRQRNIPPPPICIIPSNTIALSIFAKVGTRSVGEGGGGGGGGGGMSHSDRWPLPPLPFDCNRSPPSPSPWDALRQIVPKHSHSESHYVAERTSFFQVTRTSCKSR